MHDYDPLRASEQVFVTSDNPCARTDTPYERPSSVPSQDWHRADIIAAIRKTGTTLSALSRQHGLSSITLANVLARKWPRAERIIADHLGVPPWIIWPSRYNTGTPESSSVRHVTVTEPESQMTPAPSDVSEDNSK